VVAVELSEVVIVLASLIVTLEEAVIEALVVSLDTPVLLAVDDTVTVTVLVWVVVGDVTTQPTNELSGFTAAATAKFSTSTKVSHEVGLRNAMDPEGIQIGLATLSKASARESLENENPSLGADESYP
jgi:hypothetical protein